MKRLGFVVRTMIGVTNRVPIRMQHVLTILSEVVVCCDSLLCPRPVHIQDAKDATFVQHTVRLGVAREYSTIACTFGILKLARRDLLGQIQVNQQ